jgi:hypothetical protein
MSKDKVAANNVSKIRVKLIGAKDSTAIEVFAVDAKEILATGRYECVGQPPRGSAEWLPAKEIAKPVVETPKESDDEITEEKVLSMNSKELETCVKENKLEIEGFDSMNLPKKRQAVIDAFIKLESEEEEL